MTAPDQTPPPRTPRDDTGVHDTGLDHTGLDDTGPDDTGLDDTGLEVLDTEECIARLARTPIGRMAFVEDGRLTVLPVTYGWHEGGIVFRTLHGGKLSAAAHREEVAFEVDEWDADHHSGWSVLVRGTARVVTDWAEVEELEQSGVIAWAKERWRDRWVRIEPDEITGRRIP